MIAGEPALVSFNGGTKDNAINRECKAELVYADHAAAEEMCIRDRKRWKSITSRRSRRSCLGWSATA